MIHPQVRDQISAMREMGYAVVVYHPSEYDEIITRVELEAAMVRHANELLDETWMTKIYEDRDGVAPSSPEV